MPVFDGLKNHDISRYFLQYIVTFYILHCKKFDENKCKIVTAIHYKLRKQSFAVAFNSKTLKNML